MKHCLKFFSDKKFIAIALPLLLLATVVGSVFAGSVKISFSEAMSVLLGQDTSSAAYKIIIYIRLPRIISAVLAGSALAVSGAAL